MGLSKRNVLNERNVLKAILAVDGPGSNINADMVDGYHAEELLPEIDPVTGNWVVGGVNTGQSSKGEPGLAGAAGQPGPAGPAGPAGQSAYQAAQAGGYSGTEAIFYTDLAAIQGLAASLAAL